MIENRRRQSVAELGFCGRRPVCGDREQRGKCVEDVGYDFCLTETFGRLVSRDSEISLEVEMALALIK